jgi:hypothetical protein
VAVDSAFSRQGHERHTIRGVRPIHWPRGLASFWNRRRTAIPADGDDDALDRILPALHTLLRERNEIALPDVAITLRFDSGVGAVPSVRSALARRVGAVS